MYQLNPITESFFGFGSNSITAQQFNNIVKSHILSYYTNCLNAISKTKNEDTWFELCLGSMLESCFNHCKSTLISQGLNRKTFNKIEMDIYYGFRDGIKYIYSKYPSGVYSELKKKINEIQKTPWMFDPALINKLLKS